MRRGQKHREVRREQRETVLAGEERERHEPERTHGIAGWQAGDRDDTRASLAGVRESPEATGPRGLSGVDRAGCADLAAAPRDYRADAYDSIHPMSSNAPSAASSASPSSAKHSAPAEPIPNFNSLPWEERLELITRMMREVSRVTNPADMVDVYGSWMQSITPVDRFVSLSRRDLTAPHYRITRSGLWEEQGVDVNPWHTKLPILDRGVLGELLYAGKPQILNDFNCPPDDPSCEHLEGFRSLQFIPLYENGVSINAVVTLAREPNHFDIEELPQRLWNSNLFGRATMNLVLSEQLRTAYERLDRELKVVADLQRALLPAELPSVEGLDLAAYYQTSTQAGGDYYDFFPLDDGRIGILIADVSGHGSPAAVMMAVTHAIAHMRDDEPAPPADVLTFINARLAARYTNNGTFVTAFYAIYDPRDRSLRYANAGHNPPIVRRCDGAPTLRLDENHGLPLGIEADERYVDSYVTLAPCDVLMIYTDGITEARRESDNELFGLERLEKVLCACAADAKAVVEQTVKAVNDFTDFAPATDDRTLVVGLLS